MGDGPLSGLKVVEFTHMVMGPAAGGNARRARC